MQRWLSFHHYSTPQQSDFYYLRLCNEIFSILRYDDFPDDELTLSEEEKKQLACFITAYFEDVISGPGLWRAFITQVDELYGTWLPFFDSDEYYPDEINHEDLSFLLWYFLSMILGDKNIISPIISKWSEMPEEIFGILEREYESAPENLKLKQFLNISPNEEDYHELNVRMRWIMTDSWLHHFVGKEYDEIAAEIFSEEEGEPMPEDAREPFLYDSLDTFIHSTLTPLLARKGKEWLAYTLGEDHPLFEPVLGMVEKKSGYYLFMGREGEDLLYKHIATGRELKVSSRSMQLPTDIEPGKSVSLSGFVQWKGEWWLSGAQLELGFDTDQIREEEESEESKKLFGKDQAVQREENRQLHASFLKFNRGKQLAFIESEEEANRFIREFLEYHNRFMKRSVRRRQKNRKLPEQEMIREISYDKTEHGPEEATPGMIFSDPDMGIELAFGYNGLIPDVRNPWFEEFESDGKHADDAIMLLESDYISGKWMHYLLANYDLPGIEFPGPSGRELLMDNLDFMLRFWKREDYF